MKNCKQCGKQMGSLIPHDLCHQCRSKGVCRTCNEPMLEGESPLDYICRDCQAEEILPPKQIPPSETGETGCVRSVLYPKGEGGFPIRLDLILLNDVALRRLGATYGEGQGKYGTFNWQKGFPESVYLGHAMEHLLQYMSGKSTEDDLAHAVWNLMTLMWVQEKKPELLDIKNGRV